MRMKEKLDDAMARERECGDVPREDLSQRIVELARNGSWDEAEEMFVILSAEADLYGDISAASGMNFEEAATQAGESQRDQKLWLYRKSIECVERFAAIKADTKEEAQARRDALDRVKESLAAVLPPR